MEWKWRNTTPNWNRYEAEYRPCRPRQTGDATSRNYNGAVDTGTRNTRTIQEINTAALAEVARRNAEAEKARKAAAAKPKRKRISYSERIKRREKYLDKSVIKIAKELAAIKPPANKEVVDLEISWFDNRFGTFDGILFYADKRAHVLLSHQSLWGRSDTWWKDLSIQRHPDPLPGVLPPSDDPFRGLPYAQLPDFLATLEGMHVSINGTYVGVLDKRLVPGWPMDKQKYHMYKLVAKVMPQSVDPLKASIHSQIEYRGPEHTVRLRERARAYRV